MFSLVPLVVLFPLAGFAVNLLVGRRLGRRGSGWVAVAAAGAAFAVALVQLAALAGSSFRPWDGSAAVWLSIGDFTVPWGFLVDSLSVTMMLVVTGVGTLIHVYAVGYMRADVEHNGDPARYPRFFIYLNLFLASMLVLVGADNFLMLFVGWEGVGLCSYLLIGFWFEKGPGGLGNARAAMKAFVVNRIGDFGLLLAMFLIYWTFGSLSFAEVFERAAGASPAQAVVLPAVSLLLLLGVTGKSAQLPLYVWLPDAMAGPTPVSALIHAATMVTAGIYLMIRAHVLFEAAPLVMSVVAWVGAATALLAGSIAVAQTDLKRVLAYSTISQLGFMVAAVGLGGYVAALFHLVTHAFFKALLFLSAGSVIQAVERGAHQAHDHSDPQDMRHLGGLWGRLPVTRWVYLIGALALAGLPPLAGFFSKDEILLDAFAKDPAVYGVLSLAALLTAFYMGRQLWLVFAGRPRSAAAGQASESPAVVTGPLVVLAALSVAGGLLNLPAFGAAGYPGALLLKEFLGHSLEAEALPFNLLVAGLSTLLALVGLAAAYGLYGRSPAASAETPDPLQAWLGPVFRWLQDRWYIDELYGRVVVRPFEALAAVAARAVDPGGIDAAFTGLGELTRAAAGGLARFQLGLVRRYALMMFLGAAAALAFFLIAR